MNLSPRNILLQLHLWTGLGFGILFILLGISGTALMFRTTPGIGTRTSDIRATAVGEKLPLEQVIASARASATDIPEGANVTVVLPREAGDPARVRFARPQAGRGAPGAVAVAPAAPPRPIPDILVDPVSGAVLGTAATGMTPFMQFWHDLHGQLLIGLDPGRQIVGWLGVAMTLLGLSGLYLWWPKKGQWKNAFLFRTSAKGFRFHRELHGAVGIWFWLVFTVVSFTSVGIVFPQTVRAGFSVFTGGDDMAAAPAGVPGPGRGAPRVPQVEPVPGMAAISAEDAIRIVQSSDSSLAVQSVTVPARADQAITVTAGAGRGAPRYVDPYRSALIETAAPVAQPRVQTTLDRVMALMRPLHEGEGLGPVYWTLVMISGFLPILFVITGFYMWLRKRQNKAAVGAAQ